jgi:glycosidase
MTVQRLSDLNLQDHLGGPFTASPAAWEDQVLYFLLLDRFSDGQETGYRDNDGNPVAGGTTPMLQPADGGNAVTTDADAARWRAAGTEWLGGSLAGLQSKVGYLQRLGVTAIWISPVLKQVSFQASYHGYGTQNFLDIDPHFGTLQDLRALVDTAHEHGIYVILDVVLNHTGDVFAYDPDRYWTQDRDSGRWFLDPRWDQGLYRVGGLRDPAGEPTLPFGPVDLAAHPDAWPDGAIWPAELQDPATFTQKGRISNWEWWPEYLKGDFFGLKDVALGTGPVDDYQPSPALLALTRCYQYWIAVADLDGFRVDTVKHMDLGAARFFTSAVHEFAQAIGKDNFYLIAEITGDRRFAYETAEVTGMDAALGLADVQDKLEWMVKGYRNPSEYFDLFRNSLLVGKDSHTWFRDKVVTTYDDHDQVRKGDGKARFCADQLGQRLALSVLALNATTLGIPCIYYGSEQGFDGQVPQGNREQGKDRYIREAMFGGRFGPFRSADRHCFDEDHPLYRELATILTIRRQHPALRRGRQYLRDISGDGQNFGPPRMLGGQLRSIVAWSRILADQEILAAINTDPDNPRTAWVTIDQSLHNEGDTLACLYSTDPTAIGTTVAAGRRNGKAVQLTLPPAGFVLYQ